ncbi:Homocysteine s-methyltransferase, partial [Globisporangium splendens]
MAALPNKIEIIAGGVGEELFRKGLVNDRNMLSASALVHPTNHSLVVQAHQEYMNAGATSIITSNYHVTPSLGFTVEEICEYTRLAGRLAVEAREHADKEGKVTICGSLPPLMPTYCSDRTIDHERGFDTYLLIGEALWPFVDVYVAETMSNLVEAKMAYAAVENLRKPVLISFVLNNTGQLRSGESVQEAIRGLLAFIEERLQAQANSVIPSTNDDPRSMLYGILFNCFQPEDIAKVLKHIHEDKSLFEEIKQKGLRLGGYADRISPKSTAGSMEEKLGVGSMHSALDMEIYTTFVQRWIEEGADIVGTCCGIPPSYLERIHESVLELQP